MRCLTHGTRHAPLAAHQGSNRGGFAPPESGHTGSDGAATELPNVGKRAYPDGVRPRDAIIEQCKVSGEPGKRKVLSRGKLHAQAEGGRWRTRGKNVMETMSSSFSVNAMASPPSRGMMSPARKPPTGLRSACHTVNVRNGPPNIA